MTDSTLFYYLALVAKVGVVAAVLWVQAMRVEVLAP
jgi:hypothetical protein